MSFMAKRLRIAKRLLSDRGVIFISIDDNEQAQLKLLCDEIFGELNLVGIISRATGTTTGQDAAKIGSSLDYCLAYKISDKFELFGLPLEDKDLKRFSGSDSRGAYSTLQLRKTGNADRREDRPNMFYGVRTPDGDLAYPFGPGGYLSRWRVAKSTYDEWEKEGLIEWKKNIKEPYTTDGFTQSLWTPYVKYYSEGRTKQMPSLLQNIDGNKKATHELKDIFDGEAVFNNPKPIAFVKILLQISGASDTVLDFFAGSGTTLHATMALNAEDGGKRQCILVTNNENGICENVTYERNKRVIEGYTTPKGQKVEGLKDNTLRYYRTAFVGRRRTPQNMRRLMMLATDMLCIKEDIYTEHDEFGGEPTLANGYRYFADNGRQMLIVYSEEAIYPLVELIRGMEVESPITVYVFSPANDPWTSEWEDVADKVRPTALPAAIYNAYKRVLPKPKETPIDTPKDEQIDTSIEEGLGGLFDQ
ncbi:MAG: site-specific DNA-methyltransferase [Bacteroidales bacterium]|nr:site-specific DNA-methyltransferase [Bacteroidales bacterium]